MLQAGNYPISRELLVDLARVRGMVDAQGLIHNPAHHPLHHRWQVHLLSGPSREGYQGALLSAEIGGQPHYFIYHQGTDDLRDFPSIIRLASGGTPQQFREACAFTDKAMAMVAAWHPQQAVPIVQSGYSLGGALATLSCKDGQPVIAFDPPGTREILQNAGRDPERIGQYALEVLSPHANIANAQGAHIGTIVETGTKYWQPKRCSLTNFLLMSGQTHHLDNIARQIAEAPTLTPVPAQAANRPDTVFKAFAAYFDDCMGPNPSLRERALKATNHFLMESGLDRLLTCSVLRWADKLANGISRQGKQPSAVPCPPQTPHSPQIDQPALQTAPSHGFAERLATQRQTASAERAR